MLADTVRLRSVKVPQSQSAVKPHSYLRQQHVFRNVHFEFIVMLPRHNPKPDITAYRDLHSAAAAASAMTRGTASVAAAEQHYQNNYKNPDIAIIK